MPSLGQAKSDFMIHSDIFRLMRLYLAELYGVEVLVDVYASSSEHSQLDLFGVDGFNAVFDRCRLEGHGVFVHADWKFYDMIIRDLMKAKILTIIVAPIWEHCDWYGMLLRYCSHIWLLPSCNGVFSPISRSYGSCIGPSPWDVFIGFADFSKPALPVIVKRLQSIDECSIYVQKIKRPLKSSGVSKLRYDSCLPRCPFNTLYLEKMSHNVVPDTLRMHVLEGLRIGFASGYRGKGQLRRDFSHNLNDKEKALAYDKMMKEVKKGFCLGPFNDCPFPSEWCSNEAYICQLFLIPKHKFVPNNEFRLIANKSFPDGRSFNDLVGRYDCTRIMSNYSYFTFQAFLGQVRRLGPNCLISLFDIKDAYKNVKIRPEDLWQQVYKVDNKYFIDLAGMFGSRNAGDSWNLMMEFIALCLRYHCNVSEFNYFVDNGVNLTQAIEGKCNFKKAKSEFDAMINFLRMAKIPYHQDVSPCTKVKFLGWLIDTETMTVTCPPERLQWIRKIIDNGSFQVTRKLVQSVTGLLEFLAAVLPFLRAPLGWLQKRNTEQVADKDMCNDDFKHRFQSYFRYIEALMHDWKGSASIYAPLTVETPDLVVYSDASGEIGFGAIEVNSKSYFHGKWSTEEVLVATRSKAVSSTHLEILAIIKAVKTFAKPFKSVQVFADSAAAIYILQKRYDRSSDHTQALIISLDRFCRDNSISVFFEHVPRENSMIQLVDSLSKSIVPAFFDKWSRVKFVSVVPTIF